MKGMVSPTLNLGNEKKWESRLDIITTPVGSAKLQGMDDTHLITIEPCKRSGQPCIRGMWITVRDVLE